MAVTVAQFAYAIQVSADGASLLPELSERLSRLLGTASATVDLLAPDAPDDVKDSAVISMAGYLYEQPPAGRLSSFANAFSNSGAGSLLFYWTPKGFADSTGTIAVPGVPSVGGLNAAQVGVLIATHAAIVAAHHAPGMGGPGGAGVHLLTAVPPASFGVDGETALVRVSSIVLHAYRKVAGAWVRQWAFSGGDSVLLAGSLSAIPDRNPGPDPDSTRFEREIVISGYDSINLDRIDNVVPASVNGVRVVNALEQWQGGLTSNLQPHGNSSGGRDNDVTPPGLTYTFTMPAYVYLGLKEAETLEIASVSQGGADIPLEADTMDIEEHGETIRWYRTTNTYTQAEIQSADYVLVVQRVAGTPATFNRYAVVTGNPVPTAADFLSDDANASASISILIPNAGWVNGRGYLHFALPSAQDAPTVAGLPGGINLIDDFTVRSSVNTVTLRGATMRTLSSDSEVFQMTDLYSLFAWIVR